MVVVLPAPLCPRRPKTSPASMARDRQRTAIQTLGGSSEVQQKQEELQQFESFWNSFLRFCSNQKHNN